MRAVEITESLSLMILIWWRREKKAAMEIATQWADASHFHLSCTIKHINCVLYFLKLPKFLPLLISTGKAVLGKSFLWRCTWTGAQCANWRTRSNGDKEASYCGQSNLSCWEDKCQVIAHLWLFCFGTRAHICTAAHCARHPPKPLYRSPLQLNRGEKI